MNYSGLCKAVADIHANAEVVIVLSKAKLAASHLKSGGPAPDEKEFRKMISQLDKVITTVKTNEDKFGDLGFVTVHYKYVDGLFFPINDKDTLIIGIMPPYDHDAFVSRVTALVNKEKKS
ncbi:MAG TPA: hypothetical protein VLA68_02225 [Nitrososphaera sp.]|nr:hypothetical protein [Nitrososphaera sp.]